MTVWKITYRTMGGMPQAVEADYFKRDDGWFSFKTADHKVILDVCAEDVRSVEKLDHGIIHPRATNGQN